MIRRRVLFPASVALAGVVVRSRPDVVRYRHLSEM
jgi:hypothetical protein